MTRAPPYTEAQGFIQLVETDADDASSASSSRHATSGFLGAFATPFKKSGTVTLKLDNPVVYVDPSASSSSSTLAPSPCLSGTVVLAPSEGRSFSLLTITLRGIADLVLPDGSRESHVLVAKKLAAQTDRSDSRQTFAFRFEMPKDAAPTATDRTWGKVAWNVRAEARGEKAWGEVAAEKPFRVVAMPTGEGLDGVSLQYSLETFSKDLGPYHLALSASPLTVSAPVSITFRLAYLPNPVVIHALNVYLVTKPVLTPSRCRAIECGPQKTRLLPLEGRRRKWRGDRGVCEVEEGPAELPIALTEADASCELAYTVRLPNHDQMIPSTPSRTKNPLSMSHALSIELMYSLLPTPSGGPLGPPQRKTLSIAKPLQIASCLCTADALLLPAYASSDPHLESARLPSSHASSRGDVSGASKRKPDEGGWEAMKPWCACSLATPSHPVWLDDKRTTTLGAWEGDASWHSRMTAKRLLS